MDMKIASDDRYAQVRGFNYQPSYASHGIEIWGDRFDLAAIERELGLGRRYFPGFNTVRLWLSLDAFLQDADRFCRNFASVLDVVGRLDLRAIPTVFNACPGFPAFGNVVPSLVQYWSETEGRYAQVFAPYLSRVVGGHRHDSRILMWDLCNEPGSIEFLPWLRKVRAQCKDLDPETPLTVGACPEMAHVRFLEEVSDVITFHPYYMYMPDDITEEHIRELAAFIDEVVTFANEVRKPLLAAETGWGSLDDRRRADKLAIELGELAKRKIGFLASLLHHTLVADGHRPDRGPVSHAGYMAFIEEDGSLRPYHDVFNRY